MNCFVLRVDGVLCVGLCCLLSVTVLGQVGGAPGLRGRHRASPMSARAASPPSPPCFEHACGAELFQPPTPHCQTCTKRSLELV